MPYRVPESRFDLLAGETAVRSCMTGYRARSAMAEYARQGISVQAVPAREKVIYSRSPRHAPPPQQGYKLNEGEEVFLREIWNQRQERPFLFCEVCDDPKKGRMLRVLKDKGYLRKEGSMQKKVLWKLTARAHRFLERAVPISS